MSDTDAVEGADLDEAMRLLRGLTDAMKSGPETIELHNGIVLNVKTVSEVSLRTVVNSVPKPDVPIEPMGPGKIMEPWPESPEYLAELEQAMLERNRRLAHACGVLGTSCLSVPDGYSRPEDDDWLDALRIAGVAPALMDIATPMDRYAKWLDLHALTQFLDVNLITQSVMMRSVIMEVDVHECIRFFQRDRGGSTTGDIDTAVDGSDPDNLRAGDAGMRDRDGTTGHGAGPRDTVAGVEKDGTDGEGTGDSASESRDTRRAAPKRSRRKGTARKSGPQVGEVQA